MKLTFKKLIPLPLHTKITLVQGGDDDILNHWTGWEKKVVKLLTQRRKMVSQSPNRKRGEISASRNNKAIKESATGRKVVQD